MPTNYDSVDLEFSWNGDFQLGKDGDIADTYNDQIQTLIQNIQTVVNSELNDWKEHPALGAGLDDFVGEPNTKDTARQINARIVGALVQNNIVLEDDVTVKVVPVDRHTVFITITVTALATADNSLEGTSVTTSLVFDYFERGVVFLQG